MTRRANVACSPVAGIVTSRGSALIRNRPSVLSAGAPGRGDAALSLSALGAVAGTLAIPTCTPSRPVPVLHTHGTSESLSAALAASSHQVAGQAAETLHTAREAFTVSLHVTGVIAAVVFAGLAVLVLVMRPARERASAPVSELVTAAH